jgi:hypothetical protein
VIASLAKPPGPSAHPKGANELLAKQNIDDQKDHQQIGSTVRFTRGKRSIGCLKVPIAKRRWHSDPCGRSAAPRSRRNNRGERLEKGTKMIEVANYIDGEGRLPDVLRQAAIGIPLSEAEFHCFCDANNGTAFDTPTLEGGFGLNVADSEPDELAEKWDVNLPALAGKLNALSTLQKSALLAAMDGFFRRARA